MSVDKVNKINKVPDLYCIFLKMKYAQEVTLSYSVNNLVRPVFQPGL
jgi:hypothetical protein